MSLFNELFKVALSIPQYGYRLGYWMPNGKWGIELKFDHAKYVQVIDQTLHLRGNINGTFYDKDTLVDDKFLQFEHTDGANFWMMNAVRRFEFFNPSKNFTASYVVKPGAGIVFPRTDVTIFGEHLNNNWIIAGWIVGVETGLRLEFFKHGFFERKIWQLRKKITQPFFKKYSSSNFHLPSTDFIHECGFYCGNYPEMTKSELNLIQSCLMEKE